MIGPIASYIAVNRNYRRLYWSVTSMQQVIGTGADDDLRCVIIQAHERGVHPEAIIQFNERADPRYTLSSIDPDGTFNLDYRFGNNLHVYHLDDGTVKLEVS